MAKTISRVAATVCATALSGSVLVAAPSSAAPGIGSVRARVARLYHQAEQASERYNNSRDRLAQASRRLDIASADLSSAQATVRQLRRQVATAVVAQYQGQALASVKVLLSQNPDSFLAGLATISQYDNQRKQMAAAFAVRSRQLAMRREAARRVRDQIARTEHQMATDQAAIQAKLKTAEALLVRLKEKAAAAAAARAAAAQRAAARRQASRSATRPAPKPAPAAPAPSSGPAAPAPAPAPAPAGAVGRAAIAVRYALAHVGDAYVYGAAGPTAFDCSGLTMMAWRAAGVSLPHNAAAQMGYGTPVAESQLRPGDLVFYYSPVSHVGMYIGHGKIVNAENPSVGVVVAPVGLMPYAGAVRIG